MSLGRGFAVFSLAGVVAAAVLCGTARPTHANCGAGTSLVVPDQSGALDITWRYDSTNDTYSITLHNKMPVWYYVLESHPATGGACWLWLSQEHPHNLGTDRLPEAIAPHGKIELRDLHFVPGDRFGICNIGLTDAPPGYSAETAWVKAIVTMDIVGLAFLGESIGTAFAEGGALGVLKRIINSLTFGQFDKVLHLIDVLGQPNQSLSAIVSALLDVVTVSSAEKSEMMETFRAAFPGKVAGLGKGVSDLFELNTGIDLARRAIKFLPEWAAISIAYGEAPWGRLGVGVVAAPPGTNAPPDGFILQPTDDQLVGNTVSVHGVASDDCSTIQFVNATYSADNGQTWIFGLSSRFSG